MAEKVNSPFCRRIDCSKKSDFDQYYYDIQDKDVFRKAGIDSDGEEYGVIEKKFIVNKIDIRETLNEQAKDVGVEAYMRALAVQGENIDDFKTEVDMNQVNDFSEMPETLADVMMAGDAAKKAFAELDPALKGSHTTIEGFLNSLSKETIDSYIKGKVDAAFPQEVVKSEGGVK